MSRRQHVAGARCRCPPVGGPEDAQNWPIWPLTPRTIRGSQSAQNRQRVCPSTQANATVLTLRSGQAMRPVSEGGATLAPNWSRAVSPLTVVRCSSRRPMAPPMRRLPAASAERPARAASAYRRAGSASAHTRPCVERYERWWSNRYSIRCRSVGWPVIGRSFGGQFEGQNAAVEGCSEPVSACVS
jgi:hypothetical protein